MLPRENQHGLKPLQWTNGGEIASCNIFTGYDSRGRRTWCRHWRTIVHYDASGRPMPTRDWPARRIGHSLRKL